MYVRKGVNHLLRLLLIFAFKHNLFLSDSKAQYSITTMTIDVAK